MGPSIAGCSILKGIRLARRITTWYAAQQHHAGSWEGLEGTSQHLWFLHSEPLPITPLRQQKWTAWWSRFGILPARLAPERSHKSMETDSNTILITTKIAGICEWKSNHFDQSQHQLQTSLGYAKRSQNQRPQRLYTLLRNLYEKGAGRPVSGWAIPKMIGEMYDNVAYRCRSEIGMDMWYVRIITALAGMRAEIETTKRQSVNLFDFSMATAEIKHSVALRYSKWNDMTWHYITLHPTCVYIYMHMYHTYHMYIYIYTCMHMHGQM